MIRVVSRALQRDVSRLLRGERSREAAVDVFEDARSRAKIRRDPKYVVGKLGLDRVPYREVGGEIGSSEAVDGLLGIADQEKLAGSEAALLPGTGGFVGSGQEKKDFRLHGIRVLELVHQYAQEMLAGGGPYLGILAEDFAAGKEQIVEIHHRRSPLERVVFGEEPVELGREHADDRSCDPAHQRAVGFAASRVMLFCLVGERSTLHVSLGALPKSSVACIRGDRTIWIA